MIGQVRTAAASTLRTLTAGLGLLGLILALGRGFRPELSSQEPFFPPDLVAEARALRSIQPDAVDPPRLQVAVDYAAGEDAAWRPRGESPILEELVKSGKLPVVAERTGPEPVVLAGAEGIGRYGGSWYYVGSAIGDFEMVTHRLAGTSLVRWSPQGYPLVPHLAKSWEIRDEYREFIFHLRRGVRWSDGHPFTANDIMYWWELEATDPQVMSQPPEFMMHLGSAGTVEQIDDFTIRIRFEQPNILFLEKLASNKSTDLISRPRKSMLTPAHYFRPYHPRVGDQELIRRTLRARGLNSASTLYDELHAWQNPECPRLWPWLYRTYQPTPPIRFVRNPYYFAVDSAGNQLPYVDQLLLDLKTQELAALAASNGEPTMQFENIRFDQYTLLMAQRAHGNYRLLHWYSGNASPALIYPNMNLRVDPARPDSRARRELLNERRFRQALSVALNRARIVRAEYSGQAEPKQLAPDRLSPLYEPTLPDAYAQFDPALANRLLDELGLVQRDGEGFRTFADGSRMQFYLNFPDTGYGKLALWVCRDWANVGIRVTPRERNRRLFITELQANEQDFTLWNMNGKINDLMEPKNFVASIGSYFAQDWGHWYFRGGLRGNPQAELGSAESPPPGHPMLEAMRLTDQALAAPSPARQAEIFRQVLRLAAENVWMINVCRSPPTLVMVKDGFRNVPDVAFYNWDFVAPSNAGIETFYWENQELSAVARERLSHELLEVTPAPAAQAARREAAPSRVTTFLRVGVGAVVAIALVLAALRHPLIGRRLMIMVPTLAVISFCSFVIIQLPPGDFATTEVLRLQAMGAEADLAQVQAMRRMFHLDEPLLERYASWMGLKWFTSLAHEDRGLLQGYLGRSMESYESVNDLVGDRVLLTVAISIATILFTWALALPIGIYSAVRQYTWGDYLFTFLGFFGMCVPGFLLAVVLMFLSSRYLGVNISGLFSPEYVARPEWSWGKFVDLLKHIWVPVAVIGLSSTASMIRVMRGNLLDELKRPYVTTARAKGLRPLRLLLKYPVRLALNPFVSGLGALFPALVSGGTIVALVMSLPTLGPLLLQSLMNEDTYVAASLLMILSVLGVAGTLVSDLLLVLLDPRIRLGKDSP